MPRKPSPIASRFDDAGASPGFVLWQVATVWQRAVREALQAADLTHAQFVMLASAAWLTTHAESDEVITQTRIAEHARTDAVMTSEVLRTLERRGLLRRDPHPSDARARQIVLTDDGWALAQRAFPIVEAVDAAFFGSPGPELRALARLLGSDSGV